MSIFFSNNMFVGYVNKFEVEQWKSGFSGAFRRQGEAIFNVHV